MLAVVRIDVGGHHAVDGTRKGSVQAIGQDGFEDGPFKEPVLFSFGPVQFCVALGGARLRIL